MKMRYIFKRWMKTIFKNMLTWRIFTEITQEQEEMDNLAHADYRKHLIASTLENCKDMDTRALIAISVCLSQELQNGLILGAMFRSLHEKGHPGAYLNHVDDVLMALWEPVDPEFPDFGSFYDLLENDRIEGKFEIPLSRHGISATPWHLGRLKCALRYFGTEQPWKQQHDHAFQVYWPIPVIWIISGNHSFAAGILNKDGVLKLNSNKVTIYNITRLYDLVYCDGNCLRRKKDNTIIKRVGRSPLDWDVRWGILFELGRLISQKPDWMESMEAWCKEVTVYSSCAEVW